MGGAKEELIRREELYNRGQDALKEAGAAEECPHGTLLSNDDPDAEKRAYAIGTNWVKDGLVDGERKEFMDAIGSALADAQGECSLCVKNEEE